LIGNGAAGGAGLTQTTGAAVVFDTTNHLVATYDGTKARAAAFREHYLLFLDLLDFREEVPESGNTTSASAG
jgi:hypothetical protein